MNPNDVPVKFPLNTRVRVINGFNDGMRGSIIGERRDGKNNHVSFDGGGDAWFSDHELEALPVPEVGDLVRVTKTGRWTAQEGHVTGKDKFGMLTVDLEHDFDLPIFEPRYLQVIEKVKPLPVRIEGKEIKPEDIKRGDKISVVSVEDNEIKRTTILEATVDQIDKKGFYGQHLEFKARTGAKIHSTELAPKDVVISLVADIDKDSDFEALSKIKPTEIIGFPDEEGGPEVNIAVKKEYSDQWTVILGEKAAKSMQTIGLVAHLRKRNVTFSVIRKAPNPLEFPNGTHVRVSQDYAINLWQGHYKVVIENPTHSVIKSRGISASTYTVPNEYLRKD